MARVIVSGGTGLVGRFVVEAFVAQGDTVVTAGRHTPAADFFTGRVDFRPMRLAPDGFDRSMFDGVDIFVHAAFDHLPGRYRGGEGDDPEGFVRANLHGSVALFEAARAAGVRRVVFLSSRAVYGDHAPGVPLTEETALRPDTLYGIVKRDGEEALLAMAGDGFAPVVLRVTGVYGPAGPGRAHKWAGLFTDYLEGKPIAPRAGTEVHGLDMAAAVVCVARGDAADVAGKVFNVSDIVVDRRDILAILAEESGVRRELPPRADHSSLAVMDTSRLRALGWQPGGVALLRETVRDMARTSLAAGQ